MADTYYSACFTFCCTNAEMALLEEAFNAANDLNCELEPPAPSQELLAAFPPPDGGDPWSGLLAIFDDAKFPILGADLTGGNSFEEPTVSTPMISGTVDFQPWPIAELVRRCCKASLAKAPVCFEWAVTCSRARPGEFGGGRCVIFAVRIDIQSTGEALRVALDRPDRQYRFAGSSASARSSGSAAGRPEPAHQCAGIFPPPCVQGLARYRAAQITWHCWGEPVEWSDVIVMVDSSLSGEGSNADTPAPIWERILDACRTHLGPGQGSSPHYMVRLTNLDG
ncbi:hypothetical protein K3M67_20915 (plasmid) [Sphingobium sp. V4]|uniref:hypothetical protein n=1 Tax=Sphingobium sp. V4 TaxID=3038927 RepID=UPI002557D894|nr:hypothetical protein [Sphingobium sp. V4]WIW90476.1 hypothetical protein K3M67_20915 [Sphingobium sp. V4]